MVGIRFRVTSKKAALQPATTSSEGYLMGQFIARKSYGGVYNKGKSKIRSARTCTNWIQVEDMLSKSNKETKKQTVSQRRNTRLMYLGLIFISCKCDTWYVFGMQFRLTLTSSVTAETGKN